MPVELYCAWMTKHTVTCPWNVWYFRKYCVLMNVIVCVCTYAQMCMNVKWGWWMCPLCSECNMRMMNVSSLLISSNPPWPYLYSWVRGVVCCCMGLWIYRLWSGLVSVTEYNQWWSRLCNSQGRLLHRAAIISECMAGQSGASPVQTHCCRASTVCQTSTDAWIVFMLNLVSHNQ